ncbi:hypothetical protein PLESTB_001657000 [Pleodorina starrii]|uniref:Uncharacterized protein n=1 Tax=Pleodorina starrii TaxID=330485 RepID=A0A9W6BYL4_9CHLO|nr:hypothetical protein PLESTB_001657000 [Pleodorina starrii]GLC69673.1 hypothetical protein PLESTF_000863200 [Pleodorina starrii]
MDGLALLQQDTAAAAYSDEVLKEFEDVIHAALGYALPGSAGAEAPGRGLGGAGSSSGVVAVGGAGSAGAEAIRRRACGLRRTLRRVPRQRLEPQRLEPQHRGGRQGPSQGGGPHARGPPGRGLACSRAAAVGPAEVEVLLRRALQSALGRGGGCKHRPTCCGAAPPRPSPRAAPAAAAARVGARCPPPVCCPCGALPACRPAGTPTGRLRHRTGAMCRGRGWGGPAGMGWEPAARPRSRHWVQVQQQLLRRLVVAPRRGGARAGQHAALV